MNHPLSTFGAAVALLSLLGTATAAAVKDRHGNVGFDTAAECDAAVRSGAVKFYESFTTKPPLVRPGEARVKAMTLGEVPVPQGQSSVATSYAAGACDLGAGASGGRDGVGKELQGRYVPYSAAMPVNVYYDKANNPVRVSMKQCDNWFSGRFPRPVAAAAVVQRAAPVPAPVAVAPAPVPAPAPAPAPVAAPPAPKPAPVAAPVPPKPAPAVAAAKGGISTGAAIGIGAALIAVPLLLGNHGDDDGATGTTGTTGTR